MICLAQTELDRQRLEGLGVNAAELVSDGRTYSGSVKKPWGSEREIWLTPEFSMWRLTIEQGQETSMHCHPSKTTLLIVEKGNVVFGTLGIEFPVHEGKSVLIERGVFHRTRAPLGAVVVEVEWPPNRCDLVRLEDKYGRKKTGYEGC